MPMQEKRLLTVSPEYVPRDQRGETACFSAFCLEICGVLYLISRSLLSSCHHHPPRGDNPLVFFFLQSYLRFFLDHIQVCFSLTIVILCQYESLLFLLTVLRTPSFLLPVSPKRTQPFLFSSYIFQPSGPNQIWETPKREVLKRLKLVIAASGLFSPTTI